MQIIVYKLFLDAYTYSRCGLLYIKPGCTHTAEEPGKQYPDCCAKQICPKSS